MINKMMYSSKIMNILDTTSWHMILEINEFTAVSVADSSLNPDRELQPIGYILTLKPTKKIKALGPNLL
jgi:hypothetical protein